MGFEFWGEDEKDRQKGRDESVFRKTQRPRALRSNNQNKHKRCLPNSGVMEWKGHGGYGK